MAAYPNIYPNVVLQLHPKLKELLIQYGQNGQIDCDNLGYPYLIAVKRLGNNVQAFIVRNGKLGSIIMNPRAKTQSPDLSWDPNDGYVAKTRTGPQIAASERRERPMRESYLHLVEQIMESE